MRGDSGIVPVAASELLRHEVLPPSLAEFCADYSGIVLELALSYRNEVLFRRDANTFVRMARPTQEALVPRRTGTVKLGPFAHRRYADRFGLPKISGDLAHHHWIAFDSDA